MDRALKGQVLGMYYSGFLLLFGLKFILPPLDIGLGSLGEVMVRVLNTWLPFQVLARPCAYDPWLPSFSIV